MLPHIIISSAHLGDNNRKVQYTESFETVKNRIDKFKSATILETVHNERLDYLENSGINVVYSNIGNPHNNKGKNWVCHIENFLLGSETSGNEIYIFLAGRYKILNDNIFDLINELIINNKYNLFAKEDSETNDIISQGVHTFYFSFRKFKFLEFVKWYNSEGNFNLCVEHEMKRYMDSQEDCLVIKKETYLGLEARVWGTGRNFNC